MFETKTQLTKVTSGLTRFLKRLNIGDKGHITNSSDPMVNVNRDVDSTVSGNGHCFSDSSTITRSGNTAYNSFDCRIVVDDNGGTYHHFAPFQNGAIYNGGSTGIAYGYVDVPAMKGTANVSTRYGVYVADMGGDGTGTLTSNFGVYVPELTKGSVQNFAIVTKGRTKSLFEGEVIFQGGINATSKITAKSLQVTTGNVQIDTDCYARKFKSLQGGDWSIEGSPSVGLNILAGEGTAHDLAVMVKDKSQFILTVPKNTNGVQLHGNVGFFANSPQAKQVVAGSRGGNAALTSLLTALHQYGLIDNQTTA